MGGNKGSGSTSATTTQISEPNPVILNDYQNAVNRATSAANAPLQQYAGPMVAGFTPMQQTAFNTVDASQGIADPYINSAAQYVSSGANPITPIQFSPGSGGAGDPNTYLSPYIQNVVNSTQAQFNNQNAQQQQQVIGNAITSGAWGGDRSAIAQAELANQQQLAQAPVIAGLYNQGYNTALGEFNTQQQAGIGAQEASGWLGENAGFAMGNLGQEAQSTALTGASSELQSGALQQQLAQEGLNIPYEEFLQQQAYPFQTANYLANITEGIGGLSGGESSTTTPNGNLVSGLGGLGMAGAGLFSGLGGGGDPTAGTDSFFTGSPTNGVSQGLTTADGIPLGAWRGGRQRPRRDYGGAISDYGFNDLPGDPSVPNADVNFITMPPANAGGKGPPNPPVAAGGGGGGSSSSSGGMDLSTILPLAEAALQAYGAYGGAFRRGGRTHFDAGGGAGGAISTAPPSPMFNNSLVGSRGIATPQLNPNAAHTAPSVNPYASPGITPMSPNAFAPNTIPLPASQITPMTPSLQFQNASNLNTSANSGSNNDTAAIIGGIADAAMIAAMFLNRGGRTPSRRRGYDYGGSVMSAGAGMGGMPAMGGNPIAGAMLQQYSKLPPEKLQELAVRVPPNSPQGQMIQRALMQAKMRPQGPQPQIAGPTSPAAPQGAAPPQAGAPPQVQPQQPQMRRGGRAHYDGGGDIYDASGSPDIASEWGDVFASQGAGMSTPDGTTVYAQPGDATDALRAVATGSAAPSPAPSYTPLQTPDSYAGMTPAQRDVSIIGTGTEGGERGAPDVLPWMADKAGSAIKSVGQGISDYFTRPIGPDPYENHYTETPPSDAPPGSAQAATPSGAIQEGSSGIRYGAGHSGAGVSDEPDVPPQYPPVGTPGPKPPVPEKTQASGPSKHGGDEADRNPHHKDKDDVKQGGDHPSAPNGSMQPYEASPAPQFQPFKSAYPARSPWELAVATGAGMMASRNPNPLIATGEGLQHGLSYLQKGREDEVGQYKAETEARRFSDEAETTRQRLGMESKHYSEMEQHYQDESAHWREMEKQGRWTLTPGYGIDPSTGETVPGAYKFNGRSGQQEFMPGVVPTSKQGNPQVTYAHLVNAQLEHLRKLEADRARQDPNYKTRDETALRQDAESYARKQMGAGFVPSTPAAAQQPPASPTNYTAQNPWKAPQGADENTIRQQFQALPSGAVYLNPSDGKLYTKS